MTPRWVPRALGIAFAAGTMAACGGSSSPVPSPTRTIAAVIAISGLNATVEPLTTTPSPGLLYRLTYQVRESSGTSGATLLTQHFVLSNGSTADGTFNNAPHVLAAGVITIESTLSIYPATARATHVTFSIAYTDDTGKPGTANAEADVASIG